MEPERLCAWCRRPIPPEVRSDARFCPGKLGRRCRQTAWRLRQHWTDAESQDGPRTFGYADPPYPGRARRYYGQPEVDHPSLIARLEREFPDGWALSTAADALRLVLPLCPPQAHVCPWVKTIGAAKRTKGLHYTWEPLIVVRGRQRAPGVRDWLAAQPARGGGDLVGRKPIAFCAFLFRALGMVPGDKLVDLFPGTGIVTRAWFELSSTAVDINLSSSAGNMSLGAPDDR